MGLGVGEEEEMTGGGTMLVLDRDATWEGIPGWMGGTGFVGWWCAGLVEIGIGVDAVDRLLWAWSRFAVRDVVVAVPTSVAAVVALIPSNASVTGKSSSCTSSNSPYQSSPASPPPSNPLLKSLS